MVQIGGFRPLHNLLVLLGYLSFSFVSRSKFVHRILKIFPDSFVFQASNCSRRRFLGFPTFSILSLPQWRCPDLSGKLTSTKAVFFFFYYDFD